MNINSDLITDIKVTIHGHFIFYKDCTYSRKCVSNIKGTPHAMNAQIKNVFSHKT